MMDLRTSLYTGSCTKWVENTYTQLYQHKEILIDKWNTGDFNPVYEAKHDQRFKHSCT